MPVDIEQKIRPTCKRCGGSIVRNYDEAFCLLCGQSYSLQQYHGAWGGQKTLAKYGLGYMKELGKRGGRPKLRQLPAPEVQSQLKGGNRLPNSLKGLRELYNCKIKDGES